MHSSNHTFVINNIGNVNTTDIIELNYDDTNYFEGNIFSKIISIREENEDTNNSNKNTIVTDFTIILLLCLGVFTICISLKNIIFRFKF